LQPSIRVKGRTWYSFRDLIGLKVARELLGAGLSLQRVRRSLDALKVKLPEIDQPLSRLRIRCEHDRVIVDTGEQTFEAATGQGLLDFSVQTLQQQATQVLAIPRAHDDTADEDRSAYEWFTIACEREKAWDGQDPDDPAFLDARQAYDRALDQDPEFAAAYTNLGALLAAVGDLDGARDHFDQALRCDPDQPEAQSNLAALALRLGDHDTAIAGAIACCCAPRRITSRRTTVWPARCWRSAARARRWPTSSASVPGSTAWRRPKRTARSRSAGSRSRR
jgi:DNA-binding transcriptional MerR regulator